MVFNLKHGETKTMAATFKKSALRISTMTVTANWGMPIQLNTIFEQIKQYLIPIWYPGEGILKYEHRGNVLGAAYKDIFTNRKVTTKSFFNQSTIVLRKFVSEEAGWKEVNIKLFANGGIQMTGVSSKDFAIDSVMILLGILRKLPKSPFQGTAPTAVTKIVVPLINTDYSLDQDIQQDNLHKILIEKYNLFSMLEKTIYQGVNTKYFYNKAGTQPGICTCAKFCKGQGNGSGEGECKRITMSIFRTGRIIITGARDMEQIEAAYNFLNGVFEKHASEVLLKQSTQVTATK
jgi:TATA-box binding protein (TBP) (component of TFIID and TFIIIB)